MNAQVIADPEIRIERLTQQVSCLLCPPILQREISCHPPSPEDEFLFMACDGLFDVFTSQAGRGADSPP